MSLLARLRDGLRTWLLSGYSPPEIETNRLDISIDGTVVDVDAVAVVGLHLQIVSGGMVRLINESQATDRTKFWRVWKRLGGTAKWEDDGAAFEP